MPDRYRVIIDHIGAESTALAVAEHFDTEGARQAGFLVHVEHYDAEGSDNVKAGGADLWDEVAR